MSHLPPAVIQSAKQMAKHYEAMEDLSMMETAKAGNSRRAFYFIRNDLPLMLDVAQGRNPADREDLNERQKALLDMTPQDAAEKIKSDLSSARRVLGWTAPFATGENKDFVLGRDNFTNSLVDNFKAHLESQKSPEFTGKGYSNSKENPLAPNLYADIMKREAQTPSWPKVGEKVIPVREASRDRSQNPYEGEAKKVEEVVFMGHPDATAGQSPYYYQQYRLEGETEFLKRGEMLDPRATRQSFGVVAERAGRLYFVELDKFDNDPHEPQDMVAREVIGMSNGFAEWINGQIKSSENPEAKENPAPDIKWALAMDDKEPIVGEFLHYYVDGPLDKAGPIVIDGSSWQSGTGEDEKKWAIEAIDRHLEKYEYPSRTIDEEVTRQRGNREVLVNAPKFESMRYGLVQQQGMAY